MHAVGLCPLHERDVFYGRRGEERFHQIAEHELVAMHHLLVEPASRQAVRLVQRGIDDMSDIPPGGEHPAALPLVPEVEGQPL